MSRSRPSMLPSQLWTTSTSLAPVSRSRATRPSSSSCFLSFLSFLSFMSFVLAVNAKADQIPPVIFARLQGRQCGFTDPHFETAQTFRCSPVFHPREPHDQALAVQSRLDRLGDYRLPGHRPGPVRTRRRPAPQLPLPIVQNVVGRLGIGRQPHPAPNAMGAGNMSGAQPGCLFSIGSLRAASHRPPAFAGRCQAALASPLTSAWLSSLATRSESCAPCPCQYSMRSRSIRSRSSCPRAMGL
jgi:hypothetical protein